MKTIYYLLTAVLFVSIASSCGKLSYKKTKSGLLYKIIEGKGKDSLIKNGEIAKFQFETKYKDSVLYSSYGKMPGFARVQELTELPYNLLEVLPLMKKGDSAVTVQLTDTILSRGMQAQLPPDIKKGERIITTMRIMEVYSSDSLAMADYNAEMEKDKPRKAKEQEEQMAKMKKARSEQDLKEYNELEKSGEAAKQRKVVEDYLLSKKITAKKTIRGTYVLIKEQGNGPKAEAGKYLTIKYSGRRLANDSTFESNTYPGLQIGMGNVVSGWDEGLQLFNEGGKGTLYIPAYMAYGNNPRPGPIKPGDALIFDVEIIKVSDEPEPGQ